MLDQLQTLLRGLEIQPIALLDVGLTALLIYGLFSLIRGTRAVRLVIGVTVLYGVYVAAQVLGLQLLSQILQTGAVVGLLALVVVFQPELRRALERIGRVGSLGWLVTPASQGVVEKVAREVARAAAMLGAQRQGALMIIERETGLQDTAESGVMLDAGLTAELLGTVFTAHAPLHDGAVIIRGTRIVAAAVVLPLSETSLNRERLGTRHRAAIGITEQTDALAVVVSEETGQVRLVEHGRMLRNLDEEQLHAALTNLLRPASARSRGRILLPGVARPRFERGLRMRGARSRRAALARKSSAESATVPVTTRTGPAAVAPREQR